MYRIVSIVGALWLTASIAHAGDRTLVLPVTTDGSGEPSALMELAERLADELNRHELDPLRPKEARERFIHRHSHDPGRATKEDIDLLAEATSQAINAVAQRQYAEANQLLENARRFTDGALETINRDLMWDPETLAGRDPETLAGRPTGCVARSPAADG
jgi:hypothetical protein